MTQFEYLHLINNIYYDYAKYTEKVIKRNWLGYYSEEVELRIQQLDSYINVLEDYLIDDPLDLNILTITQANTILQAVEILLNKNYNLRF